MSSSSLPPPAGDAAASVPTESFDPTLDWYALVTPDDPQAKAKPLGPHSTLKEIKTAYRQKARDLHPDKNPDPKAAVLFHQLQRAFAALSDSTQRAAYDARLIAAEARAKKDATLDAALSGMKKDLLRREAEAAAARLAASIRAKSRAQNGGMSEEDRTRQANEKLLREMSGVLHPPPQQRGEERPAKSRRYDEHDSSVHAGTVSSSSSVNASDDESKDAGDEKSRTVSVRWAKSSTPVSALPHPLPTPFSISSILDRFGVIAHVLPKSDHRGAFVVYQKRKSALAAAQADERTGLPKGWVVKMMQDKGHKAEGTAAPSPASNPAARTAAVESTTATSGTTSSAAPVASTTALPPLPTLPPLDRSKMTSEEYEAATLARMAQLAKARRAQKEAAAAAVAAAAKADTITIDGDESMPQK